MSGTAELIRPPHQADSGTGVHLFTQDKIFNPFTAPVEIGFRIAEVNLLFTNMTLEGAQSARILRQFNEMHSSQDPKARAIFNGEGLSRDYPKKVVVANGFSPPPELILETLEEYIQEPYAPFLNNCPVIQSGKNNFQTARSLQLDMMQAMIGIKSNDFLVPFNRWVQGLGHNVMFGYDEPNELQTETFFDLVNTLEFQAGKDEVTGIGLSAGGMFQELAADYLLRKHGRPVVNMVVKGGSPEITQNTISDFSEASHHPTGVMGMVHGIAKRRMSEDPIRSQKYENSSLLEEMMIDYSFRGPDPRIKIVTYYSKTDSTVPQPQDPTQAIEVGGTHMAILYQPALLAHLGRLLSLPNTTIPQQMAA